MSLPPVAAAMCAWALLVCMCRLRVVAPAFFICALPLATADPQQRLTCSLGAAVVGVRMLNASAYPCHAVWLYVTKQQRPLPAPRQFMVTGSPHVVPPHLRL